MAWLRRHLSPTDPTTVLMIDRAALPRFALGALVVLGACATSPAAAPEAPDRPGAIPVVSDEEVSAGTSASLDRLEAVYRARQDSARMNISDADVAFMNGMIPHHAQALVMSAMAPDNQASPAILTLTSRITNAQKDEIAVMQRWLRERELPVPEVGEDGRMAMDMAGGGMAGDHSGHADHAQMAGMLSPAQLDELAEARGIDFDRLFLTFMIQHHEGAVTMVRDLFAQDGAAQDEFVFKLASDIQADQTTEVARMRRMLEALPPSRTPDASPTPSNEDSPT